MLTLLTSFIHFALSTVNPAVRCELKHRDPGVAGTYYLYCSQMTPGEIELITVGRFISDAKASHE